MNEDRYGLSRLPVVGGCSLDAFASLVNGQASLRLERARAYAWRPIRRGIGRMQRLRTARLQVGEQECRTTVQGLPKRPRASRWLSARTTERRWEALSRAVASLRAQTRAVDEVIVVVDHNPELLARVSGELDRSRRSRKSQSPRVVRRQKRRRGDRQERPRGIPR